MVLNKSTFLREISPKMLPSFLIAVHFGYSYTDETKKNIGNETEKNALGEDKIISLWCQKNPLDSKKSRIIKTIVLPKESSSFSLQVSAA